MKYDLHIHSKYSYDSFLKPETIIKIARKRGLNGVAVTDHNTIKGGLKTAQLNTYDDFEVVIGSEIKTEFGDVIGLFLNEEITVKKFYEVIDKIKSQDGISILAHPYRQFDSPGVIIEKINLVEGFNARSKKPLNICSQNLARKYKKAVVGGSDAHSVFEIGRGFTTTNAKMEDSLRKRDTGIGGNETNYYVTHGLSFGRELVKKII